MFKSKPKRDSLQEQKDAAEALGMIELNRAQSSTIKWFDKLLKCKVGLREYSKHDPMICGSLSVWVDDNDEICIRKY